MLTMHAEDESLLSALHRGARGYLVKGADKAELIRSILAVPGGQAVYGANALPWLGSWLLGVRLLAGRYSPRLTAAIRRSRPR